VQKSTFKDGGFVLHRVTLDDHAGYYSAWYDHAGRLQGAEQTDALGRKRSVSNGSAAWLKLGRRGYYVARGTV
jgi:hypothetical protein